MSTHRYKLLNGGGVMKMKRWFGFLWRDYENFDNAIHASEHKLHDQWVKMQTEKANLERLKKGKKAIIKSIGDATGKQKGLGEPFGGKPFSGFRKPDVDAAPSDWKEAFNGKRAGHKPDASYTLDDVNTPEVQSWLIPKSERVQYDRQDRGGKKGQQQKGQQQNN
jgi:hypothetical protein